MNGFHLDLPDDKALAKKVIEANVAHEAARLQQGVLGRFFGDVGNKPGNIAGFAIILSALMITLTLFAPVASDVPRREVLVLFGGIFTSALGFLFGRSTR